MWELFRFHPPSLQLYVRLCAASPYLSGILTTNPGMIDELVDSLQLDKLPTPASCKPRWPSCAAARRDTLPILHDFKNAQHLRIGVRDMLGKEDIDRTHEALADVAETCLAHVAAAGVSSSLWRNSACPTIGPGPMRGRALPLVIVGLGKLGGREPNYHSDLEVLFLYEGGGTHAAGRPLAPPAADRQQPLLHAARAADRLSRSAQLTPKGRLYPIDAVLRPIGVGGALALSLADFAQHFSSGAAPLWQWQALCQARPVFGELTTCCRGPEPGGSVAHQPAVDGCGSRPGASVAAAARARRSRRRTSSAGRAAPSMSSTSRRCSNCSTPRGSHRCSPPARRKPCAAWPMPEHSQRSLAAQLGDSYRYLRRVESGLRLLETKARHDLPTGAEPLHQLALLVGHSNPAKLRDQCLAHMADNRAAFLRLTETAE